MPGKKVGKYMLSRVLGTGGYAEVKLGVDTETGKEYAVKQIKREAIELNNMKEQLEREVKLMKLLDHENVVKLYEVLQSARTIYLILEFVPGGELFDKIVTGNVDEETGRKYFQQLIVGVYYCHKRRVAHRDLKPENLLLDSNDNLKITDFGLSNLQRAPPPEDGNDGTQLHTVCGTPNYMAPEVMEGNYNGHSADIWSCGVILFVMLAGRLPFDNPDKPALQRQIKNGEFKMSGRFSEGTKDLISKMLVVDTSKRIRIEQIFEHEWFSVGFDRSKATDIESLDGGSSSE